MPVAYDDGASPGDHVANLSGTNATFAAIVSELETARPNWVAFLDWSMDRGYILVLTDLSDFGSGYEVDHANKVIRIDNFDAGIIGGTSRTDEEMADFLYKALRDNVLLEHWGWIPEVKKIGDSMPVTYEALMIVGTLANGALDHWGGMTNIFGSQNRCYAYADAMHFSYTSELVRRQSRILG